MREGLTGIPKGAIAVVVVGLALCAVAALLTIDEDEGGARIDWELTGAIADSRPASLGTDGSLQITDGGIEATRDNASGFSLFRIAGELDVDLAGYDGPAEAHCTVRVPPGSVLARTPGKRAAYPLPSDDLATQAVPELSVVRFNAKGTDLVGVEVEDAFDDFTNADAARVEWTPYRQGEQGWDWVLEPARREEPVTLAFVTMWRTTGTPGARIVCSARAGDPGARAATGGKLG